MDQSTWPERYLPVTGLLLDAQNPRIPRSGTDRSQRELIAELIKHDKVYRLARKIVRVGWWRMESLIGYDQQPSGKTIILEGNRRVAALKLLLSPELAPDDDIRRFRRLAHSANTEAIKRVKVLIAPDRYAAGPMISDKHTHEQTEKWSRVMQANFFRTLMADGTTVEDLHEQFGVTPAQAAAFLRRSWVYAIACNLDLPDDVATVVRNPRRFRSSTLDRLLDNPKVADFLGVTFDPKKGLRGHVPADEFKAAFTRVVSDIAKRTIDSRTMNTTEAQNAYLKSIAGFKPTGKKKGSFTAKDLVDQSGPLTKAAANAAPATKKRTRVNTSIIPTGWTCTLNNGRIRDVFDELKRLKPIASYDNSVAVMLRLLLELALASHFLKTGKMQLLLKRMPPGKIGRQYSMPLRSMLKYVIDEDNLLDPHGLRALDKLFKGQHTSFSLDSMNDFVHNINTSPDPKELTNIWRMLEPLMKIILVEPAVGDEGANAN